MMKKALRKQILEKRDDLSENEIRERSKAIINKLYSLPEFKEAKNILFYVSVNTEVDTQQAIKNLLAGNDKTIIIPYVVEDKSLLQLSKLNSFNELERKTSDILEPKEAYIRKYDPEKLDLIIVPGLVFDALGNRIGYGQGYYDKFLKTLNNKPKTIGLAYDFQMVEKIPSKQHDVPVDIIVTEKINYKCN